MTLQGVDCSRPISGAALAAVGKSFVGRYLADHPTGDLSAAEAADHHAHGVADLLLREYSTDDLGSDSSARGGAAQAIQKAQALAVPADNTYALVLCEDNANPDDAAVEADMADAAGVIRAAGYLAGFYGRKDIARNLAAAGKIDVTFPVMTWGTDESGDEWNFRQLPNNGQQAIGGVWCDVDDAPNPVGLWLPPTPAPAPTPPPTTVTPTGDPAVPHEITTTVAIGVDPSGKGLAGWTLVGYFAADVESVEIVNPDPSTDGGVYAHFNAPGISDGPSTGTTKIEITSSDMPGQPPWPGAGPWHVGLRIFVTV